jgi:hypothetical protein
MESPQPVFETPVKKSQTPLIIAVVVIVLCCCCVVLAVAGYYSFTAISSTQTQTFPLEDATPEIESPSSDSYPNNDSVEIPSVDVSPGEAPVGGLGNDILRNDTWQYVSSAAVGLGCDQPVGADSTIEVLEEPSNGVWREKWTVACESGDDYPFEVEFVLDDTGATFNIKSLP